MKKLHSVAFVCALLFIVYLVLPALAQGGITFTAEVDRTTLSTDDLLTLTLSVSGDYQQLGEPQLPLLGGFDVVGSSRSSQFSMVNGVVSSRTAFTYRLRPTGPGTFTIEPATIVANGTTYQTDPLTVEVTQGAAPTPSSEPAPGQTPAAPAPEGLQGQDLYIEAEVSNPTPFVGQQIIYYFRFYQAVNLFSQPRLGWPGFGGFWTEDLAPNNVYEQNTAGKRYRVTEVRRALFATGSGQVTLQPATLTIPGDMFNREIVLETGPVVIDVQPLPPGAPDGFVGTVGQFEIDSWIEPAEGRVNEPLTLFVRVSGTGNLTTLPDPTAEALLPGWRVYDPQTTTNVDQAGDTIRGEKLFERLLVPTAEGELTIPAFSLAYFDPQAAEYHRVETEPLVAPIAPGENPAPGPLPNENDKQEITQLGSDIRHIKAAPPTLSLRHRPLLERPVYWLAWLVPLAGVASAWARERRQRRLAGDVAYARAQRAHRQARRRLAQARQQDQDAAYATVARALTEYLGDKFNLPPAGLTRDAIRHTLEARAIPDPLVARFLACLDWADSGRFAPAAAGRGATDLVTETETILSELERTIS